MAIECWSEDGHKIEGESGELVCIKPFPSMPVSFWNDPNGEKYHRAYFDKYPGEIFLIKSFFLINFCFIGIWNHSDFCLINPVTRGIVMLGRRFFIEKNYFLKIKFLFLVMVHLIQMVFDLVQLKFIQLSINLMVKYLIVYV
jgi:hypothetical protein